MADPVFPPELEHKIFEMAFDPMDCSKNGQMMLVARRTRLWIRPLVYRIFDQRIVMTRGQGSYETRGPFPKLRNLPPFVDMDEICQFARHLSIDDTLYTAPEVASLIYQCLNLVNIGCWGDCDPLEIWEAISGLEHLKRLSGAFTKITDEHIKMPIFASLTHLEIIHPTSNWPFHTLTSLRRLTHLSIYLSYGAGGDENCRTIRATISAWSHIQILLFSINGHQLSDVERDLYDHDHRVVFVHCEMNSDRDWHRGAQGIRDVWYYAGNMVYARKHKLLKSDDYQSTPMSEDFHWVDHLTDAGKEWFMSL